MGKATIPVAPILLLATVVLLGAGLLRWEREAMAPPPGVLKVAYVFDRWTGQQWRTVYKSEGRLTVLQILGEVLRARTAEVLGREEYRHEVEAASQQKQRYGVSVNSEQVFDKSAKGHTETKDLGAAIRQF